MAKGMTYGILPFPDTDNHVLEVANVNFIWNV